MAASAVSRVSSDTPVSEAFEIFEVDLDVGTSVVITPTSIKAITFVDVTPTNAGGAAAGSGYASYSYGDPTVTINGANNDTFTVKVIGKVA